MPVFLNTLKYCKPSESEVCLDGAAGQWRSREPPLSTVQITLVLRVHWGPTRPDYTSGLELLSADVEDLTRKKQLGGLWELTTWGRLIKEVINNPHSPLEDLLEVPREDGTQRTNLEHIVTAQLYVHLQTNNLYEPLKPGSHPSHSTETALVKVINNLLTSADSGTLNILLFLDPSTASDNVNHSPDTILLQRVRQLGVESAALD